MDSAVLPEPLLWPLARLGWAMLSADQRERVLADSATGAVEVDTLAGLLARR